MHAGEGLPLARARRASLLRLLPVSRRRRPVRPLLVEVQRVVLAVGDRLVEVGDGLVVVEVVLGVVEVVLGVVVGLRV